MQVKPNIANLPAYKPGKPVEDVKRELGLTEIIKLASNENPFGCSPKAKEAIERELSGLSIYPDGAGVTLTNALAKKHGVNADQIILGDGSDEIILMLARAYLSPGDETIMADLTFSQYKHNAQVENAVIVEVPMANGKHDLPAMAARVTAKTKIIWVCNPNNPTGTIVTKNELVAFLDQVPQNVMVVLDEAYCEYIEDPTYPDGLELLPKYPNLVLLRTFSKIFGLAALRVGYGIASADIINDVNPIRPPFNTSRVGQAAAAAALEDEAFIAYCREQNKKGLQFLNAAFAEMGLTPFPAYGNFIMVDVKRSGYDVYDALLRRGIIVRAGFGANYIRITVGSQEQNEKVITALKSVLQEVEVKV
ncbi:histidinol-phosphate transaminase [Cohnella yongneupensis]|uniref:Histidinol-phosphate aminotransferase n=1 Tax=Cohnella yongneupensis TaxID=425006 RepID=A0ABW0R3F5_9BACL